MSTNEPLTSDTFLDDECRRHIEIVNLRHKNTKPQTELEITITVREKTNGIFNLIAKKTIIAEVAETESYHAAIHYIEKLT